MKNMLGNPAGSPTGPMPNPNQPTNPNVGGGAKSFDITNIKQFFHVIIKRVWLVVLCFIIAVSVAVVALMKQEPYFKSVATLQVTKVSSSVSALTGGSTMAGADYYAIQENILHSQTLLNRAQERLGIPVAEFKQAIKRLDVKPNPRTGTIKLGVESFQPVIGANFANRMAEEYISYKDEERIDDSQNTVIDLTQQANRIRDELRKAEEKLQAFRSANSIIAVSGRINIAAKHLSQLTGKAANYRTERLLLQAQQPLLDDASDEIILRALLGDGGGGATSVGFSGSDTNNVGSARGGVDSLLRNEIVKGGTDWRRIKREKAQLQSALGNYRSKFKDNHPRVLDVMNKLKELDLELQVELQFALEDYNAKLDTLRLKEQAVQQVAAEWEKEAQRIATKEHSLKLLERDVTRLQSLYEVVFNRLKEMQISFGTPGENIRIMERATPASSPVSNRQVQNIFLAALIGVGIGIALVFGLEYIDDSLRYPEEVASVLQLPFFGVIPSANWDPEDLNSHMLSNIDQKSGLAEAYRNVRSALIFSGALKPGSTVAFSSAVPREGKTTTCLNMSVSLAQAGSRILLVDADMRRGELHKFFGLEGGRGLSDLLAGNSKPEALIQRTGIPNLDLIATGPFPPNPSELLLQPEFNSFLEYAKRSYDYILFDCPPVMAVSESAVMASLVDSTLFVVWAGQTSRKLSEMSVRILRERGANIVGCVLNNLEFGRVGYYYYSTYYGYYDYDYRYESRPS
ncbi:MAG: succinoglycan biosynthesis transport protein ExoP [Kiritimatiellia bacterium]|jgi:succinoglycan biosynthesis transport protein ExoP